MIDDKKYVSQIGIEIALILLLVTSVSMLSVYIGQADRLEAYNDELICDNMGLLEDIGDIKASHAMMLSDLSFMSGAITGHMFEELTALNVQRMSRALRQALTDKSSLLGLGMQEGEK